MNSENMVEVKNVRKKFGMLEVLNGVDFTLRKGETTAVIGPSGSGKSTLLRCLIGLETVDGGDITIENFTVCKDGVYSMEKEAKKAYINLGMVFQHFNLFPHMNVRDNLMFAPMHHKKGTKAELSERCIAMLAKVNLADKIDAMPSKLSGGQKQRVAIARALMMEPDILLFDEPTSALDPELTSEVLNVIKNLAEEKTTMAIITHEINFAREAADRIVFMDGGKVVMEGSPDEVLDGTGNGRIRSFLDKIL